MLMEKILTKIYICIPLLLYQWKLNGRDKSRVLSMKREPVSRIWWFAFALGVHISDATWSRFETAAILQTSQRVEKDTIAHMIAKCALPVQISNLKSRVGSDGMREDECPPQIMDDENVTVLVFNLLMNALCRSRILIIVWLQIPFSSSQSPILQHCKTTFPKNVNPSYSIIFI